MTKVYRKISSITRVIVVLQKKLLKSIPNKRALLEEKLEGREYKDAEAQTLMEDIIKETLDSLQV